MLLDAHAILHRAYHALPDFKSQVTGEPTGALYGVSAFLIKVIRELKPDYIAACYDLPEPTFRHIAYDEYKGKRPKMDSELAGQIARSRDLMKAFDIPVYEKPGFEADDILGTIVEKLKDKDDIKIFVASGDMDTMQLVRNGDVVVYTLKKGINDTMVYDQKAVKERFGFLPVFLPDFKGLSGDPSDNIIGIPGIGAKTATALVENFGTIENIYKKLKTEKGEEEFIGKGFKSRIIKLLKEHEEDALFSKELATIRRDAPIEFSLRDSEFNDLSKDEKRKKEVKDIFSNLGFNSLMARLNGVVDNNSAVNLNSSQEIEAKEKNISLEDGILNKIEEMYKSGVFSKDVYEIERRLVPVVLEMEKNGALLDIAFLKKLSAEYHREEKRIEKKIWKLAGREFNIDSPKQLSEILFVTLGINSKKIKKTPGGVLSTKASELEKIREEFPIVNDILSYREIRKLLTTYVDTLPKLAETDGRLHAKFDQLGTATGRFASSEPNLQNIPVKSELGRNIRKAFVAPKGAKLVAFDYSQIELRVLAILSEDKELMGVFKNGGDIHASVAAHVFKVEVKDVDREMRRKAKIINFGIIYGMGINALRVNLGCPREEAQKFYDKYFESFPRMAEYLKEQKEMAHKEGFTETLFGRRRYFPEIASRVPFIEKEAERQAVNHPIQGTAADIVKIAMVKADEALLKRGLLKKVRLILQIHDELVYEADEKFIDEAASIITEEMEGVIGEKSKGIPISVDVKMGDNWDQMEKVK